MADRVNKDLTKWTAAERLWLWQFAQGWTNRDAAAHYGCGERHYGKVVAGTKEIDYVAPAQPTVSHLLQLARRRYGRGLAGTAALVRVSPPTLHKWEREANVKLISFWEKKGFKGFTIRHS